MHRALALAALVALATACGSSGGNQQGSKTSPSGSAAATSASPSAVVSPPPAVATSSDATFNLLATKQPAGFASQITCSGSIGTSDPVAVVQLHTGGVVLRDYAVPAAPRSVCQFTASYLAIQLIDARHIVTTGGGSTYAVVDLPAVRYHWFKLPDLSTFVAVGPKLDQVTWFSADEAGSTDKVHITDRAGDHVIATLPNPHGGRCGGADDSKQGGYTRSGQHLFVLDQPTPTINSLVVVEGLTSKMSLIPPGAGWAQGAQPEMAVWSATSESLYYRQGSDVWVWTPGSNPARYLQGVSWYYPTITPDGAHLAYAVARSDGLHNVYLVDLAQGGSPRMIGKGTRNLPVFLTSNLLWFKSEGQGVCGPGGNQPLIYDLTDSTESGSVIDAVLAVWPASSSNF